MEIQTTVKADTEEIEELKSALMFKGSNYFIDCLNTLLNKAFQLGRTYERDKRINKLDYKE